jgi:hypothetical protein
MILFTQEQSVNPHREIILEWENIKNSRGAQRTSSQKAERAALTLARPSLFLEQIIDQEPWPLGLTNEMWLRIFMIGNIGLGLEGWRCVISFPGA